MDESMWWEREGSYLYLLHIYMPTASTSVSVIDSSYEKLKEDVLSFKQKEIIVLLGDFNARVGKAVDDVIVMFGEETSNAGGSRLMIFLNEVELVIRNGRELVTDPE